MYCRTHPNKHTSLSELCCVDGAACVRTGRVLHSRVGTGGIIVCRRQCLLLEHRKEARSLVLGRAAAGWGKGGRGKAGGQIFR